MTKFSLKTLRRLAPRLVWRWYQSRAKRQLRQNGELWLLLQNYLSATRSTGCAYSDYLTLYYYVRRYRPKEVLEGGTGVSTIILAQALRENERDFGVKGRLTSMEELAEFYNLACQLLPPPLRPYVEIRFSPTVEDRHAFIRGMRYRNVPERDYDFMFIDGPNPRAPSDGSVSCDFDFIYQVLRATNNRAISAIIDRRTTTGLAIQALFGRDKVRYDYIRELGFVGPCRAADLTDAAVSYHHVAPHPFRRRFGGIF